MPLFWPNASIANRLTANYSDSMMAAAGEAAASLEPLGEEHVLGGDHVDHRPPPACRASATSRRESDPAVARRDPTLYEPSSVYIKLVRAAESVSARVHEQLRESRLTFSQFAVLEAIYHLGPLCQRDLGAKILKSPANMTAVVDALEARGLVCRERDVEDRRYVNVSLTVEGHELLDQVLPAHMRRIAEEMSVLSPEEQHVLGELSRKLGKGRKGTP